MKLLLTESPINEFPFHRSIKKWGFESMLDQYG